MNVKLWASLTAPLATVLALSATIPVMAVCRGSGTLENQAVPHRRPCSRFLGVTETPRHIAISDYLPNQVAAACHYRIRPPTGNKSFQSSQVSFVPNE